MVMHDSFPEPVKKQKKKSKNIYVSAENRTSDPWLSNLTPSPYPNARRDFKATEIGGFSEP